MRTTNRMVASYPVLALVIAFIAIATPVRPVQAATAPDEFQQLAFGDRHACAITKRGELLCWGNNQSGQIGDGTVGDTAKTVVQAIKRNPTLVFAGGATAAAAGYAHTCAVVNEALHCWGWNKLGQVNGNPSEENIPSPTRVIENGVSAVAAGGMHTCALVRGAVLCWGADERAVGKNPSGAKGAFQPVQVIPRGVTSIVARGATTCAIVLTALQCWGDLRFGQTGGPGAASYAGPTEVIARRVTAVAIGGSNGSICAVVGGALQCWGRKYDAASATAAAGVVTIPTQIIAEGVTAVAAIGMSVCAVVHGGLQCWGYDRMGDLGGGGRAPHIVHNPAAVIAAGVSTVAMGEGYTCAVVDGALRCRGYNGYGAMSATIPMDRIADSRPFNIREGDVRTLSHTAAESEMAKEKMPARLADFLQGKLVADGHAVYFVRDARAAYLGRDTSGQITFDLDVTPLYPTASAAGEEIRDAVIPEQAPCGESELASVLHTTDPLVQKDTGFVDLKTAFTSDFPETTALMPDARSARLRLGAGDIRKIQSCAKAIHDAWESGPIKRIRMLSSNGIEEVPPNLGRRWRVPEEGLHADDLSIEVEPRPGYKAEIVVEAQSLSLMKCGALTLERWKRGLSPPWKLRTDGTVFQVDEDILRDVDTPRFPAYTREELRQAIQVEQGRQGLASVEEARACSPQIVGYQYMIRNSSTILQTVFNPGFSAAPERGCADKLPTLVLQAADRLGYVRGKRIHTAICKAWPGDPGRTIVALVREQTGATDDIGKYDLAVLVVTTRGGEILQHVLQPGTITSDAMRFDGISLDTANYALARGVRAFGVRIRHSHMGLTSASEETLSLLVPQGNVLKPVLEQLTMNLSVNDRGGECNEARETQSTLTIGGPGAHGYANLIMTETNTVETVTTRPDRCTETRSGSSLQYVLSYDGTRYELPKGFHP